MTFTYDFTGRVALVTGAGSGIGRATALAFAQAGATVIAAGRSEAGIANTVESIRTAEGIAHPISLDVSKAEQVSAAIGTIVADHGHLDIAHNNAGVFPTPTPLADVEIDTWDDTVGINLSGLFYCLHAEVAAMREHGGVIVNTASNIGFHSRRAGMAPYAATKAGVSALTAAAALDHIGDGIRINAVSPGATATAMSLRPGEDDADRAARLATVVPIGRVGEISEVVSAVLWLASDASSYVVGHDLVIDGGMTA